MYQQRSYIGVKGNYRSTWEIPYEVLLELKEWKDLRERILKRDHNTCTVCHKRGSDKLKGTYYRVLTREESAETVQTVVTDLTGNGGMVIIQQTAPVAAEPTDNPVILHVHHTYYVHGDAPWEYPDEALKTVCHECHLNIHQSSVVPVYLDHTKKESIPLTPCTRCNGVGFMPEYHYYQNGICFRCRGRKFEEFIGK